jgi:hypothetical protein
MLIAGEVHTGLLRGRHPVPAGEAQRLADLVRGEPVVVSERPISYVRSPSAPVGVDCPIIQPGRSRAIRGVGTVLQRVTLTGGHALQGSAYATLRAAESETGGRQPWSYYLARPGVVEALGRAQWPAIAAELAAPDRGPHALDLGGIAGQALTRTQRGVTASGRTRLPTARTRLRWTAEPCAGDQSPGVRFVLRRDDLRLLRIEAPEDATAEALAAVAEDVALHDWLLTTLIEVVGKAAVGVLDRDTALRRLAPAVDYLLHLWMPAARGDDLAAGVWAALDHRPGFTRQWEALVHRIRDQLTVAAAHTLGPAGAP